MVFLYTLSLFPFSVGSFLVNDVGNYNNIQKEEHRPNNRGRDNDNF